jgi:hypothetical protein
MLREVARSRLKRNHGKSAGANRSPEFGEL